MDGLQRGSAAIVGIAESDLGAVAKEMSPIDLMAQGIQRALADCGLHFAMSTAFSARRRRAEPRASH